MSAIEIPIAVRAFAIPGESRAESKDGRRGWRSQPSGGRVLIFDTETTVDDRQNLLIGSFLVLEGAKEGESQGPFRIAGRDPARPFRGLIIGDDLTPRNLDVVRRFAKEHPIQTVRHGYAMFEPMQVLSRDEFVHQVFYPEVYDLGTLCAGYHVGFDLVRLAVRCTTGRKRQREAFRIELCTHPHHPAIYLQILSNKQSFIRFASIPPARGRRRRSGRVTYQGRFLDLRQTVYALSGDSGGLENDCANFGIDAVKLPLAGFGTVTPDLIGYCIHDTEVLTAGLFTAVWQGFLEYAGVSTVNSEFYRQKKKRITEFYSPASIGKAHMEIANVAPPSLIVDSTDL